MPTELKVHPDPERRRKIFRSIANTEYLNIWEGAIRSSKTVVTILAWLNYLSETDETVFIISGRTLGTVERNLIHGDYGIEALAPGSKYKQVGKSMAILINTPKGIKTCYCFGASDVKSFPNLRGLTAGGWLADEVNVQNKEFVQECFNRTALSSDRRIFWTLNPDNPHHWIYKDPTIGIDRYTSMTPEQKKEVGGVHYWHFTPEDNPAMTPQRLAELSKQYTGFAYNRYILGERCAAEGLIYPKVNESYFQDFDRSKVDCRYCSVDFGSNHATVFYIGGPVLNENGRPDWSQWRVCYELYDENSGKDSAEYADMFVKFCEDNGLNPKKMMVAVDPAALVMKNSLIRRGINAFNAKNDVLEGIRFCQSLISQGHVLFHRSCRNLLACFGSYTWDEKAAERGEDKPLKANDDAADSFRYWGYTHIRPMVQL